MVQALTYGPYYTPAIRRGEVQRRALGMEGYTPEQLSGIAYGELRSRYETEMDRQREERQYQLQKQSQALQFRQQRNLEESQAQQQWGQMIAGGATILNVMDQIGGWDWLDETVGGLAISVENLWDWGMGLFDFG